MTRPRSVRPATLLPIFTANTLDALIDATFALLASSVACDFVSAFYATSDRGLLRERDSRGRSYSPEFMRRYVQLTPALPLALAHPGIKLISTRLALPCDRRTLIASEFYQTIMVAQGWRHGVALCFWGEPAAKSPIFVATVYRRAGRADFSNADVARLAEMHAIVDCGVTRLQERAVAEAVRDGIGATARGRGVAVLDGQLHLISLNARAVRLLAGWSSDRREGSHCRDRPGALPATLAAACLSLLRKWHTHIADTPHVQVPRTRIDIAHPSMAHLRASIALVSHQSSGILAPFFVVELERRASGAVAPGVSAIAPVLAQMTRSQREVAVALADGLSNQEIADRLGKTIHAVKYLLHRIYRRTGTSGRTALIGEMRQGPVAPAL